MIGLNGSSTAMGTLAMAGTAMVGAAVKWYHAAMPVVVPVAQAQAPRITPEEVNEYLNTFQRFDQWGPMAMLMLITAVAIALAVGSVVVLVRYALATAKDAKEREASLGKQLIESHTMMAAAFQKNNDIMSLWGTRFVEIGSAIQNSVSACGFAREAMKEWAMEMKRQNGREPQ